jgi:hypothetical protein
LDVPLQIFFGCFIGNLAFKIFIEKHRYKEYNTGRGGHNGFLIDTKTTKLLTFIPTME